MNVIGRKSEKDALQRLYESPKSEFLMVYGRRRVGKTYLIREVFKDKFDFYLTGIAQGNRQEQLSNFRSAMFAVNESLGMKAPANWFEAFGQLVQLLEHSRKARKVVFLDELPWIDTPKSDFVKALEHFWNSWASARTDILLIVCGSAASWLVKNIVRNHGGLHNRLTYRMKISPFCLSECRQFLHSKGIRWENRMVAECYMVMGGIPYYLSLLDRGLSLAQNIDRLFFAEAPLLEDEFQNLYASLFHHSEEYIRIVEALSRKKAGFTREEILNLTKVSDGGGLTRRLEELEQCGFIRKYRAVGGVSALYQLVDFYSLFYFNFIKKGPTFDTDNWMHLTTTPTYNTWCGLSFERLCLAHLPQIKAALGISGVSTNTYSFYSREAQIDMVIERGDQLINVCEMKFTDMPFVITKSYVDKLKQKVQAFSQTLKKRRSVQLVIISSAGLCPNDYSVNLVQKTISLEDLFT
ncbi:MAG: AAA family ATPase [Bacteroidaceae bacterium]|nr:AAA family ATPase [Bacteroidaceae bacterium]